MDIQKMYILFQQHLINTYPQVKFRLRDGINNNRVSPYVLNEYDDKRWMQIDLGVKRVSIVMDHFEGEISEYDVRETGIPYGLNNKNTRIELHNNNAVKLSIFINEPIDFNDKKFNYFLRKHFNSYLRRVDREDLMN